jgi:hypothetical protein
VAPNDPHSVRDPVAGRYAVSQDRGGGARKPTERGYRLDEALDPPTSRANVEYQVAFKLGRWLDVTVMQRRLTAS